MVSLRLPERLVKRLDTLAEQELRTRVNMHSCAFARGVGEAGRETTPSALKHPVVRLQGTKTFREAAGTQPPTIKYNDPGWGV